MKIRNGFVSNSSSSSFILTINFRKFEQIEALYRNIWYLLMDSDYSLELADETNNNYEYNENRLKEFLNKYQINIKLNNKNNYEISSWTAMYNSVEDIPNVLKFLTLSYLIEGYDVNLEAESDY